MERYASCVDDSTAALELQPNYTKVTLRRAVAREKLEKYEDALEDFRAVLAAGACVVDRSVR
jgi:hypothetical protein